jgi:hypothetical protein
MHGANTNLHQAIGCEKDKLNPAFCGDKNLKTQFAR